MAPPLIDYSRAFFQKRRPLLYRSLINTPLMILCVVIVAMMVGVLSNNLQINNPGAR
jgi:hypothetical protein